MSRNRYSNVPCPLGTAYAPAAEGSAEGDILGTKIVLVDQSMGVSAYDEMSGLREDDASLKIMSGLREDDANVRLGTTPDYGFSAEVGPIPPDQMAGMPAMLVSNGHSGYMVGVSAYDEMGGLREDDANLRLGRFNPGGEGAEGVAEGSAEGARVQQMGVSAYGKLTGLREDDANIRMGISAYDEMRGLREDDANVRMGVSSYDEMSGLREDDASIRMGVSAYDEMSGLREDDANVRLGVSAYDELKGLREDDAGVRLGTAYAPSAEGESEGDYGWPSKFRATYMGVSAYDVQELKSLSRAAEEEESSGNLGRMKGYRIHAAAKAEAMKINRERRMGKKVDESEAEERIRAAAQKASDLIVSKYQGFITQAPEIVKNAVDRQMAWLRLRENAAMEGLREDNARLVLGVIDGLREDDAGLRIQGVRTAMILRGLADTEEILDEMGRRRKFVPAYKRHQRVRRKVISGAEMGAEDFHPRFPVVIEGIGRFNVSEKQLEGIFDFIFGKSLPTSDQYLGMLKVLNDRWVNNLKPRLYKLNSQSRDAIINNMRAAKAGPELYDGLATFLAEGYAGLQSFPGRWDRIQRLNAYLPTLDKLISDAESFGPQATPVQEQQKVNETAIKDVSERQAAAGETSFLEKAAPIGIAAVAAGSLTALIVSLASK